MENEPGFLPKDERIQLEYLESLLTNLTTKNIEKVVRKIRNIQFKTKSQLQHLSDLIFKFVHQRPDKIEEYAHLCGEIKDLKVTILRFETVDEKESVEIANLRFHILLTTRVEIGYDQLGAVKDSFQLFSKQQQNGSLVEVLRFVKNQMTFAGALYKHDLVTTEFLFAAINRLSLMTNMSDFFLECLISLMEQIAKDVEAQNYSLGRYFKQLKSVARDKEADGRLRERIKALLKLRATKWLGGEEEVPPEHVENIIIDENYKRKTFEAIEEELAKYISLDRCRSCCLEFKPTDRINHLTSKQHTLNMQTLLRDQYDGNLISCRERSCIICQEVDIERPFNHFNTRRHKINSTTFCYICQTKFTSAFYLSMHLKSLNHRKEILRMYDSILETTLLNELIAKENDILASDASDDDDNTPLDYTRYDRIINENAMLKNNIFKYLNLITADEINKDKQLLHDMVMEQLDRFIENIYISKNISSENTLELLKQFNQEVEDVKAAVKCVKGQFPLVSEIDRKRMEEQHKVVTLLKDQYAELCEDMQKKLAELSRVKAEQNLRSGELSVCTGFLPTVDKNTGASLEDKRHNSYNPMTISQENNPQRLKVEGKDMPAMSKTTTNFDICQSVLMENIRGKLADTTLNMINMFQENMCNKGLPEQLLEGSDAGNYRPDEKNIDTAENLRIFSDLDHFIKSKCTTKENVVESSKNVIMETSSTLQVLVENINLTAAYNGVETKLTSDKSLKEITPKIDCDPAAKTSEPIEAHKLECDSAELNSDQAKRVTKEKHESCDTKKNSIRTSGKNKRAKVKNKTLDTEKCVSPNIKVKPQEKCKRDNLPYESKIMGTTKWHVVDDLEENFNHQSGETENKFTTQAGKYEKEDDSCTVDQKNQDVNFQNTVYEKDKSDTEHPISQDYTAIGTPNAVPSVSVNSSFSSESLSKNVHQGHSVITVDERSDTLEETQPFNLAKTKIKTFAKLKRKILEKLRTGGGENHRLCEEKAAIEVTTLIKKVYMSEDIPLGLAMGILENFNRDLETKLKDLEKGTT